MNEVKNSNWEEFLTQMYYEMKEKDENISLEKIVEIARKKFKVRDKECNIGLDLIANKNKMKKK
tara:strand:- start:28 stop:219 length:192 start_codon:yes stop_codon:yes gene_type:complete